jgi:HEAT repeat protein
MTGFHTTGRVGKAMLRWECAGRASVAVLAVFAGFLAVPRSGLRAAEDVDEETLQAAHLGTGTEQLLDYLTSLSGKDGDLGRLPQLVSDLGNAAFERREQATRKLTALGLPALAPLCRARRDSDPEVRRRAAGCTERIDQAFPWYLPRSAVRLLVRRQPPRALEALLQYLPYAVGEELEEEIWYGLDGLVRADRRIKPAVMTALSDRLPARRAAAAYLVARHGDAGERLQARKLLDDEDATVRLRAAQGFLGTGDTTAIPVLIHLLDTPAVIVSWQAEELLHWAAGDEAPNATVGAGAATARERCSQAWDGWWQRKGSHLDPATLGQDCRRPGLALVCATDTVRQPEEGSVWLCGCDGKPRWRLEKLPMMADAQLLPAGRVLLAAWNWNPGGGVTSHVTERDLEGKCQWAFEGSGVPQLCRRLPDGNTFIAVDRDRYAAMEVTPEGKEVYQTPSFPRGETPFTCRELLGNGRAFCVREVMHRLEISEFDPRGTRQYARVTFQDTVQQPNLWSVLGTPDSRFLIAEPLSGRVAEVDRNGRTVWEYKVPGGARDATRLRNGITLVVTGGRLVEIDSRGHIVWEALARGNLQHVRNCLPLVRLGFELPQGTDLDLATSVPYRLKGLASKEAWIRSRSIDELEKFGPKAAAAVPALLGALDDADETVRRDAQAALVHVLGPGDLPAVLCAAQDKRLHVRIAATFLLFRFGDQPKKALPALLQALHDENPLIRREAAFAVQHYRSESKVVVPALVEALKDKAVAKTPSEVSVSHTAASSLGSLGADAKAAIPALLETVKSDDEMLRSCAFQAVGYIAKADESVASAILPSLRELLSNKAYPANRRLALIALECMGPAAKPAVPAMLDALKAKDISDPALVKSIRIAALHALERLGAAAEPAVPDVTAVLWDESRDSEERQCAAQVLGSIGRAAWVAIPALRDASRDKDPALSQTATQVLKEVRRLFSQP